MSLNDFFAAAAAAANGAVYLRPAVVSHQDCFPVPGLPHGCKPPPPPLNMQHPCSTSQKPRTMATVPPLHQVIPQPSLSSYDGNSLAFSSSRTSSFAAALRKLAKQAGDPVSGDKDVLQVSPVSSPALSQGSLTPKRTVPSQPSMFLSTHTGAYPSTSPPVVTIAPSRPHTSLSTENRKLQVMDLSSLPQGSGSSTTNGHLVEPLSLKLDASKSVPRPGPTEKWDDHSLSNKVIPPTSGSSQVRPHATIAPLPRPDDSLTSSRGFQPYRGADDVRASLPHHITSFDHHHSAYPYSPAFLPHPHLSHPAYRFEESLYLDRYSLLRPSLMTFPPQTSIMAPPSSFYPNNRYDLLAQSLSLSSANNNILNHDRLKREEEQRQRKKEADFDQNRSRDHERDHSRDKDQKEKDHREHKERDTKTEKEKRDKSLREKEERVGFVEHKKTSSTSQYIPPKKSESPSAKSDPTSHFTVNRSPPLPPPPVTSSVPLNLVVHQNNEQHKRETELWLPWQQQPTPHSNKQNYEEGFGSKNPVGINHQDNHVQSESCVQGKDFAPCPAPCISEVKIPLNSSEVKGDLEPPAKFLYDSKKLDMLHQHITELSNKENSTSDWKHEKGHRASISNHRKNSCSESKKVKEESHPNHIYNNHLRKPINGMIVKPSPYVDEGMHTRLLETEKCRIEFNGQIPNKNLSQNQQIEKISIPVLKPVHVQTSRTDIISPLQKLYAETHLQMIESPAVVSKLDQEFQKLQKTMLKGEDESFDSEDEGINLHDFVFLSKGPALPLDMDPKKMEFFHALELTTHLKRKKLEWDSYLKRRKLLHDDDEMALIDVEEKCHDPPKLTVDNFVEQYALSESLRAEASPEKLEFAFMLGLSLISPSKKEENKRLRKVIEDERIRRENRILNKMKKKATSKLVPKYGEVPSLLSPKSEAPVLVEAFIDSPKTQNGLEIPNQDGCTNFSKRKLTMFSHRRRHNLKNQWKHSTFQSDTSKTHLSASNDLQKIKNFTPPCKSVSTQVEENSICGCTVDNNNSTTGRNFIWPGLEMVIEAYIRHQTEQSFEKEILSDQYCRLRLRQVELKAQADSLNKSLVELMEARKRIEEEGQEYQRSLSSLRQLIQVSKKL